MAYITNNISQIAIIGASGFIGKCLVSALLRKDEYEIRVLSRSKKQDFCEGRLGQGVEIFEGDLSVPSSLRGFLVPGCTVINLSYLWNAGEELNLACTHNLLAACKDAKVARLIHCSTAAVAGRASDDLIDEKTQCLPISEYGTTKLKIERDIIDSVKDSFDVVILRPTSVFGVNGEPLKKLADDISTGNYWKNYLKSCLFGRRRMNLVPVANVVAAIIFVSRYTERFGGEIFIVSDDDDPQNNFIDVERFLMGALGVKEYRLPRLPIPMAVLKFFLMSLGRNNVNPLCDFDPCKLRKLGFKSPVSLIDGLAEYAAWYRASYLGEKRGGTS
ncbi:MAG: NAD-dependent epimerase/dehydratase family protein [Methylobacter sp.]|jgi:nucleoside-diphosphate-sugar epimerase